MIALKMILYASEISVAISVDELLSLFWKLLGNVLIAVDSKLFSCLMVSSSWVFVVSFVSWCTLNSVLLSLSGGVVLDSGYIRRGGAPSCPQWARVLEARTLFCCSTLKSDTPQLRREKAWAPAVAPRRRRLPAPRILLHSLAPSSFRRPLLVPGPAVVRVLHYLHPGVQVPRD